MFLLHFIIFIDTLLLKFILISTSDYSRFWEVNSKDSKLRYWAGSQLSKIKSPSRDRSIPNGTGQARYLD